MLSARKILRCLDDYWPVLEALATRSQLYSFSFFDVQALFQRYFPQLTSEQVFREAQKLLTQEILIPQAKSSQLELNRAVLEFIQFLTQEHTLGTVGDIESRINELNRLRERLDQSVRQKDVTFSYDFDRDGKREVVQLTADQLGLPTPKRRYAALEFNLEGQLTEQFRFFSSYVWSHSWGMTEGLVRSDNEQADPGWTTSYDYADLMDHGYGNLPNDRRHAVKFSGVYQLNDHWDIGFVSRVTSGAPKNRFSIHPSGVDTCKAPSLWANWCASQWYNEASFYDWDGTPSPRGSAGRQSWLTELDLALTYRTTLMAGEFSTKLTVYNILNRSTALNTNEIAQVTKTDGSFAANPDYGVATRLQEHRLTSLVVRYEF
jgi:hypothetical protein